MLAEAGFRRVVRESFLLVGVPAFIIVAVILGAELELMVIGVGAKIDLVDC